MVKLVRSVCRFAQFGKVWLRRSGVEAFCLTTIASCLSVYVAAFFAEPVRPPGVVWVAAVATVPLEIPADGPEAAALATANAEAWTSVWGELERIGRPSTIDCDLSQFQYVATGYRYCQAGWSFVKEYLNGEWRDRRYILWERLWCPAFELPAADCRPQEDFWHGTRNGRET